MKRPSDSLFLRFLETEIGLSDDAIASALEKHHEDLSLLPITLWKYQLVTSNQVGSMLDWLINKQSFSVQAPQ